MKILVINCGSSSLKYQLIDMENEQVIAKGLCERIGIAGSHIEGKTFDGREYAADPDLPDHTTAFSYVKDALLEGECKVIDSLDEKYPDLSGGLSVGPTIPGNYDTFAANADSEDSGSDAGDGGDSDAAASE